LRRFIQINSSLKQEVRRQEQSTHRNCALCSIAIQINFELALSQKPKSFFGDPKVVHGQTCEFKFIKTNHIVVRQLDELVAHLLLVDIGEW